MISSKRNELVNILKVLDAKYKAAERGFAMAEQKRRNCQIEIAAVNIQIKSASNLSESDTISIRSFCDWRRKLIDDLARLKSLERDLAAESARRRKILEDAMRQKISVEALI